MTPAGIEPATFRFVAQHLNHCATTVPIIIITLLFNAKRKTSLQKANYELPSLPSSERNRSQCRMTEMEMKYLTFYRRYHRMWGTTVAQWLRCCATNRKVAGSIPDGVIGIFH